MPCSRSLPCAAQGQSGFGLLHLKQQKRAHCSSALPLFKPCATKQSLSADGTMYLMRCLHCSLEMVQGRWPGCRPDTCISLALGICCSGLVMQCACPPVWLRALAGSILQQLFKQDSRARAE